MPVDASESETPGWWLKRLGRKILDERGDRHIGAETEPGLTTLRNYAEGRPPLPAVQGVDPNEAAEWMRDARTNWTSLVIDATAERMRVDGFRFGEAKPGSSGSQQADDEANRIWQENSLDADSGLVHYGALSQRRAFMLVERGESGRPVLTHETPTQVAVEYEQGSRRKVAAGLKLWRDDWTGNTRATLWLPDSIHHFATRRENPVFASSSAELRTWDAWSTPELADGVDVNTLGIVPLVPFVNRRNRRPEGFAEHEDVLSVQNRINLSLINLIAAMKYGAFKQRWASGLTIDEDPLTGQKINPYKLDIKTLWTSGDPATRFGEFASTDLMPYVRAVESGVQDLAALTRTPPHYLIGSVINVSGDALSAAETGLVSKVRDRNRNFGESWEQTMRLAFRVLGDKARAEAWSAETLWADPEFRSVSEMADAAVKKQAAGVPWRQRMVDMRYTPAEIARMEIDRASDALNATPATDPQQQQPTQLADRRAAKQKDDDPRTVITREPDAA